MALDPSQVEAWIQRYAAVHGVDPVVLRKLIQTESNFNPAAVSPKGAVGLGQFMPATAIELGIDPRDPEQAIEGSARYLRQNLDRFGGDYRLGLAAYNAGPGAVQKYGDVPPYSETQKYVAKILGGGPFANITYPDQSSPVLDPYSKMFASFLGPEQQAGEQVQGIPTTFGDMEVFTPEQSLGDAVLDFTLDQLEPLNFLALIGSFYGWGLGGRLAAKALGASTPALARFAKVTEVGGKATKWLQRPGAMTAGEKAIVDIAGKAPIYAPSRLNRFIVRAAEGLGGTLPFAAAEFIEEPEPGTTRLGNFAHELAVLELGDLAFIALGQAGHLIPAVARKELRRATGASIDAAIKTAKDAGLDETDAASWALAKVLRGKIQASQDLLGPEATSELLKAMETMTTLSARETVDLTADQLRDALLSNPNVLAAIRHNGMDPTVSVMSLVEDLKMEAFDNIAVNMERAAAEASARSTLGDQIMNGTRKPNYKPATQPWQEKARERPFMDRVMGELRKKQGLRTKRTKGGVEPPIPMMNTYSIQQTQAYKELSDVDRAAVDDWLYRTFDKRYEGTNTIPDQITSAIFNNTPVAEVTPEEYQILRTSVDSIEAMIIRGRFQEKAWEMRNLSTALAKAKGKPLFTVDQTTYQVLTTKEFDSLTKDEQGAVLIYAKRQSDRRMNEIRNRNAAAFDLIPDPGGAESLTDPFGQREGDIIVGPALNRYMEMLSQIFRVPAPATTAERLAAGAEWLALPPGTQLTLPGVKLTQTITQKVQQFLESSNLDLTQGTFATVAKKLAEGADIDVKTARKIVSGVRKEAASAATTAKRAAKAEAAFNKRQGTLPFDAPEPPTPPATPTPPGGKGGGGKGGGGKKVPLTPTQSSELDATLSDTISAPPEQGGLGISTDDIKSGNMTGKQAETLATAIEATYSPDGGIETTPQIRKSMLSLAKKLVAFYEEP